ncbi:MAG: Hsp20/alpha crystallin family protein [bacterium]|nr:Hsp20/alpha crystallin family protein [bacterium]
MNMIKWTPASSRNFSDFDRLFSGIFANGHAQCECTDEESSWTPRADIGESAKAYHLTIDLPGVDKGEIEIKVEDQALIVGGERKVEQNDEVAARRVERLQGKFLRRFRLPKEADTEGITAEYRDGLLTVEIAKSEKVAGKNIEVL